MVVTKHSAHFIGGRVYTVHRYVVSANGSIDLHSRFSQEGNLPDLPRMGIMLFLQPPLQQVEWLGRGPHENYPDRKTSAYFGWWKSNAKDWGVPYPKPQENGNREEVSSLLITNTKGRGVRIETLQTPFSTTVSHFTPNDLARTTHHDLLMPREEVVVNIDAAVMGLGNSSCGPGVLKKYTLQNKTYDLHLRFSRL